MVFSPYVRESGFRDAARFCLWNRGWNLQSGTILLGEFGIQRFGIRNTTQGIKNPTNDWNSGSMFHCQSESHVYVVVNAFSSANSGCKEMFSLTYILQKAVSSVELNFCGSCCLAVETCEIFLDFLQGYYGHNAKLGASSVMPA